MKERCSCS